MIKSVMFVSALALSTAAMAQEQQMPAQQAPTEQAPMQQAPAQAAPEAAAPADTAQAQPAPAQPTDVASIVAAEFPSYDGNGDGELTKEEFSKWLIALRTKSSPAGQPAPSQDELQSWAGAAFAQADTNKNTSVSQSELTTFLQG